MKNKKKYASLVSIQKRDGTLVPFDEKHISRAIIRAMDAAIEGDEKKAEEVLLGILDKLLLIKKQKKPRTIFLTLS
jgi:hypothetical protein